MLFPILSLTLNENWGKEVLSNVALASTNMVIILVN